VSSFKISPRARRAARRLGLAVEHLSGSGPDGRVIEADVLKVSQNSAPGSRQTLSGMRQTIARRLVESKQKVPHFYLRRSIKAEALTAFLPARRMLHPCSLNDIIVKAVAMAVREFPAFRSRIDGEELLTLEDSNIGVAVGLDGGVVVPVILKADMLPLDKLAAETKRLIGLAREKRVENGGRGVFSISNLGMFDVEEFTAIVNPPESGILAVGAVREVMRVEDGRASVGKALTVTLSCDHRVVDGMAAALFLNRVGEFLEAPELLVAETRDAANVQIEVERERGEYDVAVIGSGPGGYVAALQAAALGAKVAVIEKSPHLGGTCLNAGCIPSKALLASAGLLHRIQSAKNLGVMVNGPVTADWSAMQERKDAILRGLRGGIGGLFQSRRITLVAGRGRLDGAGRIQVEQEKKSTLLTATSVLLAPGSRPAVLPGFAVDGERVATTDSALHWRTLPQSLLIIGGGVIGVEFACMMQALGVAVAVVEKTSRLLPELDTEIVSSLQALLAKRGVSFHLRAEIKDFDATETGCRAVLSNGLTLEAERTLIAVGRKPNTDQLGLDSVGLALERGFLRTSDEMATSARGVFCVGDANGRCQLAHAASAQGRTAARNALGGKETLSVPMPAAVYTFPEVTGIGLTEVAARDHDLPIAIGKFPLRHLGKALASGDTEGFVKVIRHKGSDELLGVHAMGHSAIEFISAAAALIHTKAPTAQLASMVFPHPSLSEALGEAADDAYGHALHLPPGSPIS
jgi:dihydrolipoamide dehydrogenase